MGGDVEGCTGAETGQLEKPNEKDGTYRQFGPEAKIPTWD